MTYSIHSENSEDAFLEGLAYFADDLIEEAKKYGTYNASNVKEQILWTIQRALGDMDSTHF